MAAKDRDTNDMKDCSGRFWTGENRSEHREGEQKGFANVLWLLVVLSGLLFGATLVNIGIGVKVYENSSRHNVAMETLNLSIREVQKSILHLSKILEEAVQPEEQDDTDTPSSEGSI
jgi:hypothetical protein